MFGEVWDSQIVLNLPATNVPWFIGNNAKTLGLQPLQFVDMGASDEPPNGTRIVHHEADELLIQHNIISDGETASPVQERFQHSQSLCRFLSHLTSMFQRDEPFIKGHPQDNGRRRTIRLAPRRAVLHGVSGCDYLSWRRASRRSSAHLWRSFIHSATALGH